MRADVLIVGAGPAGVATAIASRMAGLQVTVADSRKPPLDKPCGEGLLPEAVSALRTLGIDVHPGIAYPLAGISFADEESSVRATIPRGMAYGMRRTSLHQLLLDRAAEVGVTFHWGARVFGLNSDGARVNGENIPCKWIVGADGSRSSVRKWAGLESRRAVRSRFGFRRHFSISPWTDFVEVYWGERCQMFVTPTGPEEVCVAFLTSDPQLRLDRAVGLFPEIEERLRGAKPTSAEVGTVTALSKARAVVRGRVALVGDASFTVDGIAGQGMSLAFQQALHLAEAFAREDLSYYKSAHRRITKMPARVTKALLLLGENAWLRRKALRLFAGNPGLFSQVVSIHTGEITADGLKVSEVFGLGWQVLRA
ncbi:MAG: NAD(P)/FAD-dependent oxidoreductase [Candidatus Acidiferrales bacterium]